jgi:hypothetical protein
MTGPSLDRKEWRPADALTANVPAASLVKHPHAPDQGKHR